jgi:hypothetical protein
MNVPLVRRRFIALIAACAIALQMFLPFAALAASVIGSASVICSSSTSSDNQAKHPACSCAAGCGICCADMAAIVPDIATPAMARSRMHRSQPRIDFQVVAVRFAPQAARPPPGRQLVSP